MLLKLDVLDTRVCITINGNQIFKKPVFKGINSLTLYAVHQVDYKQNVNRSPCSGIQEVIHLFFFLSKRNPA